MEKDMKIYRIVIRNKNGWKAEYVWAINKDSANSYAVKKAKGREYQVQEESQSMQEHIAKYIGNEIKVIK